MTEPVISQAQLEALVPFVAHLGVTISEVSATSVVAELDPVEGHATVGGGVHGGVLMGLADVAAAVAAVAASGDPRNAPATVQSSTNFLRPANGHLTARAGIVRPGRTAVVDVVIEDASGESVALVRQVVAVRPTS